MRRFPTPSELARRILRTVVGQDAAVRAVVQAVDTHFLGVAACSAQNARNPYGSQSLVLVGPTGSGKTLIVETLGQLLDVPVAVVSAAGMSGAGYVGMPTDSVHRAAIRAAGGNVARGQRCIVFIDEVDKVRASFSTDLDVAGRCVQQELLKFLDGLTVEVELSRDAPKVTYSTHQVLYVFGGAFSGIEKITARRLSGVSQVGFGCSSPPLPQPAEGVAPSPEDLIEYGMLPELVGRWTNVVSVASLNIPDLERVLRSSSLSPLRRASRLFATHGCELRVAPESVRAMAEKAHALGLGARGLQRVVSELVRDPSFLVANAPGEFASVELTPDTVLGGPAVVNRVEDGQERPTPASLALRKKVASFFSGSSTAIPRDFSQVSCDRKTLDVLKRQIRVDAATSKARSWWAEAESTCALPLVIRLAHGLVIRGATLDEFMASRSLCDGVGVETHLLHFDYRQAVNRERQHTAAHSRLPPQNEVRLDPDVEETIRSLDPSTLEEASDERVDDEPPF